MWNWKHWFLDDCVTENIGYKIGNIPAEKGVNIAVRYE
jgi:hypothetical protein